MPRALAAHGATAVTANDVDVVVCGGATWYGGYN